MFRAKAKTKNPAHGDGSRESINSLVLSSSSGENLVDGQTSIDIVMNQNKHFDVHYLGVVRDINMGTSRRRDKEAQLVDQIEAAQIENRLALSPQEEDRVIMDISRHGVKIMDNSKKVVQRHPLQIIAQVVMYEGGLGRPHVAFKIGQQQVQKLKDIYQCYVFQCQSDDQAQAICQCVKRLFGAITLT